MKTTILYSSSLNLSTSAVSMYLTGTPQNAVDDAIYKRSELISETYGLLTFIVALPLLIVLVKTKKPIRMLSFLFLDVICVAIYSSVVVTVMFLPNGVDSFPYYMIFAQVVKTIGDVFRGIYFYLRCKKVMKHTKFDRPKCRSVIQLCFATLIAGDVTAHLLQRIIIGGGLSNMDGVLVWQMIHHDKTACLVAYWADCVVELFSGVIIFSCITCGAPRVRTVLHNVHIRICVIVPWAIARTIFTSTMPEGDRGTYEFINLLLAQRMCDVVFIWLLLVDGTFLQLKKAGATKLSTTNTQKSAGNPSSAAINIPIPQTSSPLKLLQERGGYGYLDRAGGLHVEPKDSPSNGDSAVSGVLSPVIQTKSLLDDSLSTVEMGTPTRASPLPIPLSEVTPTAAVAAPLKSLHLITEPKALHDYDPRIVHKEEYCHVKPAETDCIDSATFLTSPQISATIPPDVHMDVTRNVTPGSDGTNISKGAALLSILRKRKTKIYKILQGHVIYAIGTAWKDYSASPHIRLYVSEVLEDEVVEKLSILFKHKYTIECYVVSAVDTGSEEQITASSCLHNEESERGEIFDGSGNNDFGPRRFAIISEAHARIEEDGKDKAQKLTIMASLAVETYRENNKRFLKFEVDVQTSSSGTLDEFLRPVVGNLKGFGYYIKSVDVIVRPIPNNSREQLIFPRESYPNVGEVNDFEVQWVNRATYTSEPAVKLWIGGSIDEEMDTSLVRENKLPFWNVRSTPTSSNGHHWTHSLQNERQRQYLTEYTPGMHCGTWEFCHPNELEALEAFEIIINQVAFMEFNSVVPKHVQEIPFMEIPEILTHSVKVRFKDLMKLNEWMSKAGNRTYACGTS